MTKKIRTGAPTGARNGNANKKLSDALREQIRTDPHFSARKWMSRLAAKRIDVYESTLYRIRRAK